MEKLIVVTLQVEGLHCRKDCPLEEVKFLKDPHRHIFHIRAHKSVSHGDREIEIIMFKRELLAYLRSKYGAPTSTMGIVCDFGSMSCEMIAEELFTHFELDFCEVLEDGENGGIVQIER